MQYAIVTETYPPEINGFALMVQSMARGLHACGHRVSLVRPRQAGRGAPHGLLVRDAALPRHPGLRFGRPVTMQLPRHCRGQRPHAVHVAMEGPLGWPALQAARRLRIPAATDFHMRFDHALRDYGAGALEPLALAWMRWFHNRGDATLVPTRELQLRLEAGRLANVLHLPRAVDTHLYSPAHRDRALRKARGADDETPVVLHVGRLAPGKTIGLAIRASGHVQQVRPDARSICFGDGPPRAELERVHLDLIFSGVQREHALAHHYASGDLFLFPSGMETFGNMTLEAMASGLPPVAFDYGTAREHVRDSGGGIATGPHDKELLGAATRIAGDAALRAGMASAARRAVEQPCPTRLAFDLDRLLQAPVDRHAGLAQPRAHAVPSAPVPRERSLQ